MFTLYFNTLYFMRLSLSTKCCILGQVPMYIKEISLFNKSYLIHMPDWSGVFFMLNDFESLIHVVDQLIFYCNILNNVNLL